MNSSFWLSLEFWEYVEYASAAVVVIGAALEYLTEFKIILKEDDSRRHRLSKVAALLLIGGLGIELLALVKSNRIASTNIAALNLKASKADDTAAKANERAGQAAERAGIAEEKAADATERASQNEKEAAKLRNIAETERLERLKLEAAVAPRTLSLNQQQAIASALKEFKGHNVQVSSYGTDGEGAVLGAQLISVFKAAQINIVDGRGSTTVVGQFDVGVHVRGPAEELQFLSAIGRALSSIGKLRVAPPNDPQPRTGATMGGGGKTFMPGIVFVTVMVGIKPVPVLPGAK
jgi:hypothetical protein